MPSQDSARQKAHAAGLPYIDLAAITPDPNVLALVSPAAAANYHLVPFGRRGNIMQVAMADPENLKAREAVRFLAAQHNLKAEIYVAAKSAIEKVLSHLGHPSPGTDLTKFNHEVKSAPSYQGGQDKLQSALAKAPINKIAAVIIRHAIDGLASDIHIEPGPRQTLVRYRINGSLHNSLLLPPEVQSGLVLRLKSLASLPAVASPAPQVGHFTISIDHKSYSLRAAFLPTFTGERISLHLTDTTSPPPPLTELGLTAREQNQILSATAPHRGLTIFAAPPGTEPSATLLSVLWTHSRQPHTVATIEDTVDFTLPGISQIQLQGTTSLEAASALKNLLQQDIDVIALRAGDQSLLPLALRAAAHGQTILAQTPAASLTEALLALSALDPDKSLLASALQLLIFERQLPRLCQHCRLAKELPASQQKDFLSDLKSIPKSHLKLLNLSGSKTVYDARGCPKCGENKTQGQIGVFTIIPISPKLKELLSAGVSAPALAKLLPPAQHLTLRQQGVIKALQGQVRYADVVRLTSPLYN